MAKSRRRRTSRPPERDPLGIATARRAWVDPLSRYLGLLESPLPPRQILPLPDLPAPDLREIEDRRLFHPGSKAPGTLSSQRTRLRTYPRTSQARGRPYEPFKAFQTVPHRIGFSRPRDVLVCVRRKARREVLHALGRTGGRMRPPRFTEYSTIHCR